MTISIALIGSGIFAREAHLPAIEAAGLNLKAVYSRSLKSAEGLASGLSQVDLYSDDAGPSKGYDDLLTRPDIDGVIIALPITTQLGYIQKALAAGKHVLAEKPIAKDVATAKFLLKWYQENIDTTKVTFGVAENYRFMDSFNEGAAQVKQLGKVLGFRQRVHSYVDQGGKYINTSWRKTPEYQGGFLLDGGVHHVAALRTLLGEENEPVRISAFTTQLNEHLPPADTINSTWLTKSGVSGTFSTSFGIKFSGPTEYFISCENGSVQVGRNVLHIVKNGEEPKQIDFPHERTGVNQEVKAWAESVAAGKPNPRQSAEEALKDLQILEAMLKSGEQNGAPIEIPL